MDFNDENLFDEPVAIDGSFDTNFFSNELSGSFTAPNEPVDSNSTQTVSPHDVFLDPLASDPSSTAFTNLTTPSMYDGSPDINSLETSPMFGTLDTSMTDKSNTWFSLFPDQDNEHITHVPSQRRQTKTSSPTSATASPMSRTISMDNNASNTSLHRLSVTSGITKHRRAVKVLGPIEVDAEDNTAIKRAKNTLAARKSRQKKRDVEDALRAQVEELIAERDQWRDRAIARGHPVPEA